MQIGNRKLFLLFLSAMTVSIMIMVIIYGLFIKDIDFSFNVKNPEIAPSPIDMYNDQADKTASADAPAKVSTPEDAAKADANKTEEDAKKEELPTERPQDNITNILPLEPQIGDHATSNPVPSAVNNEASGASETAPSLHFVYLDGFSSKESANQAIQQLQSRNLPVQPYIRQHRGQIILQFGVFSDRENADVMAQQLRNQNVFVKVD